MKMSLDTHDPRTCYADVSGVEEYDEQKAKAYAERYSRQVVEVWRDGSFDRAFTVELQPTVRP